LIYITLGVPLVQAIIHFPALVIGTGMVRCAAVVAFAAAAVLAGPDSPAEQTHLSLTGVAGSVAVSFAVRDWNCPAGASRGIAWGAAEDTDPNPKLTAKAVCSPAVTHAVLHQRTGSLVQVVPGRAYTDVGNTLCLFDFELVDLAPNTRYFYRVEGGAETYSFVNEPSRSGGNTYALLADFGIDNGVSGAALAAVAAKVPLKRYSLHPDTSCPIVPAIASSLAKAAVGGVFDTIIFGGDYACAPCPKQPEICPLTPSLLCR
jgi:hypothetical protein